MKLQGLDRFFWVDLLFLKSVSGKEGQKRLEELFKKRCLPTNDTQLSVEAACTHAKALMESDLCTFTSASTQGSIKAAVALLETLKKGQAPTPHPDASGFHAEVWASIPLFYSIDVPSDSKSSRASNEDAGETKRLKGLEALKFRWGELKGTPASSLGWSDLEPFQMYGHLLDPAMKKEVQKKQSELGKEVAKKHKSRKVAEKPASKRQKLSHADEEGRKAAEALLGM